MAARHIEAKDAQGQKSAGSLVASDLFTPVPQESAGGQAQGRDGDVGEPIEKEEKPNRKRDLLGQEEGNPDHGEVKVGAVQMKLVPGTVLEKPVGRPGHGNPGKTGDVAAHAVVAPDQNGNDEKEPEDPVAE